MKFFRSNDTFYRCFAANINKKIQSFSDEALPELENGILDHYILKLQKDIMALEEQQSNRAMYFNFKKIISRIILILLAILLIFLFK